MSNSESTIPTYSVDLINQLNALYPIVNPKVTDSMEVIQRRAGQRDVVERLNTLLALQEEEAEATPNQVVINQLKQGGNH